ncbi:glycosyltransferase family 25 protein [Aulographum hederae CBS 113979]|uniref:Glycosyltransferase family 25 protein n=1 Tax=Aulographum hederae CBS 113979 TaxID=1176131 RepID=A0A6G1GKT7_9PEZI|nr:glycosyltransferase family 25 protein [Aulographum hederae CBS 113979]
MGQHHRRGLLLFLFAAASTFLWVHLHNHNLRDVIHFVKLSPEDVAPVNSTLGFGGIFAVSKQGSPRRERLMFAANLTDLEIQIPSQPEWSDLDVQILKASEGSKISKGSALAWLGHINALNAFLATNLSTAMIIEDDVDWDINIRTHQIPLVAHAFRSLTASPHPPPRRRLRRGPNNLSSLFRHQSPSSPYSSSYHPDSQSQSENPSPLFTSDANKPFWGPNANWELLYLGHCGDFFHKSYLSPPSPLPHATFPDPSLPAPASLHAQTRHHLANLALPPQHRILHRSRFPLCTFAYGVTRASAARIVREFGREEEGGTHAYDVRILEACRDLGWKCWSVSPELFHHRSEGESEIAATNGNGGESGNSEGVGWDGLIQNQNQNQNQNNRNGNGNGDGDGDQLLGLVRADQNAATTANTNPQDDQTSIKARRKSSMAPNIRCGARSESFYTRDGESLEFLRRQVREGKCLVDWGEEGEGEGWP